MSLLSPSSATSGILQRLALAVAQLSPALVASVAEPMDEAAEDNSRESEDEVVSRGILMTAVVGGEVLEEAADLAGRIMISHSATAMPLLTLSRIGSCWRRLISTVCPS